MPDDPTSTSLPSTPPVSPTQAPRGITVTVEAFAASVSRAPSSVYRWIRRGWPLPPPATGLHRVGRLVLVVVDPDAWRAQQDHGASR